MDKKPETKKQYTVQVNFATSAGYREVGTTPNLDCAMREARAYTSDSLGIRVIDQAGTVVAQVK